MDSNNINLWINIQERTTRPISDPYAIAIKNPDFTANTPTVKWTDNTDSWDVVFGAIYHNSVFPIASNLLWQELSGFTPGDVYTFQFEVVSRTQGYVTATVGNDSRDFSGNGIHSFDIPIEADESSVQRVSFKGQPYGSNYFDGGITHVRIDKNTALSPVREEVWYQTKGKVYPVNDVGLPLNFQIADVTEFGKSKGSHSKTIQVVADKEADHVFGNLSNISTTFDFHDPRYKHRVQVVNDGIIEFEGFGRLQGVNYRDLQFGQKEKIYELVITDDAASFSDDASQFELSRLNLTRFDHTLNIQNIMAKSAATYGDLYCYPTLWTDDSESYRVKDFFPGFFFMDLWDLCCAQLGVTYSFSDPFVLERLRQCVIPYAGKPKLLSEVDVQKLSTRVVLRNYTEWPSTFYRDNDDWASIDTWNARVNFNTEEYDEEDQWDSVLFQFTADQSLDYTLDVNVPCEIHTQLINTVPGALLYEFTDTQTMFAALYVRVNGQLLTSVEFTDDAGGYQFNTAPADGVNGTLNMALTGQTFSLNQGDVLTVHASHAQRHRFIIPGVSFHGSMKSVLVPIMTDGATSFTARATKSEVGEGSTIQLSSYLPNLTFGDLVNYARKKWNLYIYASEYDPSLIHFDTRNDFYSGAEQLDWNDRFANDLDHGHQFIPELVAESFLFTDAKASDNFSKNYNELNGGDIYGQVKVALESDLATGTKTIGPNKFASTPIAKNRFGHYVPAIDARNMPSEPRVLLFSGAAYGNTSDTGVPIKYWNGTENVTERFPVSHCLMEDSLSNMTFTLAYGPPRVSILTSDAISYTEAGCYERYWKEYVEQVKSGKMFTGYFNLDGPEVVKLKKGLNKIVALAGNNYIINRVIDYQPNKPQPTKCELLLLENFHGLFNQGRRTVPAWSHSQTMTNKPLDTGGVFQPNGVFGNGNTVVRNANTTKSVVVGDSNFVGKDANGVLVVGKNATVDAGVENAAAIGVKYGAHLTQDGQVMITDWVEVTGDGHLVEHHWFMGGIVEDRTGLDQFTTDYPVILIGGSETESRQMPDVNDDEQHWFTYGGNEEAIYPEAPPDPPSVGR